MVSSCGSEFMTMSRSRFCGTISRESRSDGDYDQQWTVISSGLCPWGRTTSSLSGRTFGRVKCAQRQTAAGLCSRPTLWLPWASSTAKGASAARLATGDCCSLTFMYLGTCSRDVASATASLSSSEWIYVFGSGTEFGLARQSSISPSMVTPRRMAMRVYISASALCCASCSC